MLEHYSDAEQFAHASALADSLMQEFSFPVEMRDHQKQKLIGVLYLLRPKEVN